MKAERDPSLKSDHKTKNFRDARTKYFMDVSAELTVNNSSGIALSIMLKVRKADNRGLLGIKAHFRLCPRRSVVRSPTHKTRNFTEHSSGICYLPTQ